MGSKGKKEYARDEDGNRIPLIDKKTGKQKLGKRNEKLWKRITVQANDWNDRGNVEKWRKSWADICNRYLSVEQQIDHRSYKRQGLPLEPTIHERFRARQMEQRGEVSDRCEYNRIIKQLNSVTREWFQIMKALHQMIMEKARDLIRRIYDRVTGGAGYLGKAGRDSGTGGKSADGNQTPASGEQGTFHIEDKRTAGRAIDVTFQGELRKSQVPAVEKMLQHDTGILSASTAFGKTVVCSKLIAERKVSTLILLESSALMDQWVDALQDFLDIQEELPEYLTPSGRIRKRKSVIGKIHGAHDSSTGIIDIAMVGSLCKKGEFHPRLQEYGLCIMDDLRHSQVAYLINKGIEPLLIKERVGYKDIRITLNTYGHLYPNQQRRVADLLDNEKGNSPDSGNC